MTERRTARRLRSAAAATLAGLFVSLVALAAPPTAATKPTPLQAALSSGAEAAATCQSQIEHDAYELVGCVQARANEHGALPPLLAQACGLGALFRGWVMADIAAAFAVDGAEAAATELMHALLPVQEKLGVSDPQLCELLPDSCPTVIHRKREVLAAPPFKALGKPVKEKPGVKR